MHRVLVGVVVLALLAACSSGAAPNGSGGQPPPEQTAPAAGGTSETGTSETGTSEGGTPVASIEEPAPPEKVPASEKRACPPMDRPASPAAAWFTNRGQENSPIVAAQRALLCTAAKGATIKIAMYFIKDDAPDVDRILDALEWVTRHRGVKVSIIVDSSTFAEDPENHRATQARLRRFADAAFCLNGCRSEVTRVLDNGAVGSELQHNKFIVISDTIWSTDRDPLIIQSSANWSHMQLNDRYQSAIMLWQDPGLAREFDIRWRSMRVCALEAGCGQWNSLLRRLDLPADVYGIAKHDGVWYDGDPSPHPGASGRGMEVTFSPWREGDPVGDDLADYDCVGGHNTVRVAHLFITKWRGPTIQALAALKRQGCDVQIIMSAFPRPFYIDGRHRLEELGLAVQCVERVHDKIVVVDAVHRETGNAERVLWTGSHSLGFEALRRSDEALLKINAGLPGSELDKHNGLIWQQFRERYDYLAGHVVPCPTEVDPSA